jgi:hypothetical protein
MPILPLRRSVLLYRMYGAAVCHTACYYMIAALMSALTHLLPYCCAPAFSAACNFMLPPVLDNDVASDSSGKNLRRRSFILSFVIGDYAVIRRRMENNGSIGSRVTCCLRNAVPPCVITRNMPSACKQRLWRKTATFSLRLAARLPLPAVGIEATGDGG